MRRTMWDLEHILDTLADALIAVDARLHAEQSPSGLDALDELSIHPLLQDAFRQAGFGVHPEQRYPTGASRPRRSEGDRCDIVLTPGPDQHIRDPLEAGTLFAHSGVDPAEALWIEVKLAAQFAIVSDAAGANPGYTAQLLSLVPQDIRKLARDHAIASAAVLLVLFSVDESTARYDLEQWSRSAIAKALPCSAPLMRTFPIVDHLGNSVCSTCIIQVHHL